MLRRASPITVASPRRISTGFPSPPTLNATDPTVVRTVTGSGCERYANVANADEARIAKDRPVGLGPSQHAPYSMLAAGAGTGGHVKYIASRVLRDLSWSCGLALVVFTALGGSAQAAPLSACTPDTGTIVAVDFAHWGGPIVRGCGIGQRTGSALLHAAGFTTAGDLHDGPAFICRIGEHAFRDGTQYPTPRQDPCVNTPSTSRYWAYWTARSGQNRWSYNSLGPMGDVPKPGEVELWTFGATNIGGTSGSAVPRLSPSALRAQVTTPATGVPSGATPTRTGTTPKTAPAPATTSTPSTTTPAPPTGHPRASKSAAGARHKQRAPQKAATHRSQTPPRQHTQTRTTPARTAIGTPAVVAATPPSQHHSSGSPVPLIVGLGLVALLAGGAATAARRRRRYE